MLILNQYRDCSTAGLRGLDLQLINQINRLVPGLLVNFSHLPVVCGTGAHPYLQACAVRALELAIGQAPGRTLICSSAYRSLAQQMVLWTHWKSKRCQITAAAIPGLSNHNGGLALDIKEPEVWRPILEKFGWDWLGSWDRWHFDFVGPGRRDIRALSIKAFQGLWNFNCSSDSQKIPQDGCWGPKTEQALLKTPISGFARVPTGTPPLMPIRTATPALLSLRQGNSGQAVRSLQETLRKHGYSLVVDGRFGPATATAVREFQLTQGLPSDGVVGIATQAALEKFHA